MIRKNINGLMNASSRNPQTIATLSGNQFHGNGFQILAVAQGESLVLEQSVAVVVPVVSEGWACDADSAHLRLEMLRSPPVDIVTSLLFQKAET